MISDRPSVRLRTRPDGITQRQADIITLIAEGHTNREIAHRLGISENGVKGHVARLFAKFEVPTRAALVRAAQQTSVSATGASSPAEILLILSDSLSEVLGANASSALMRRAAKRAGIAEWNAVTPAKETSIETVRALVRALWPILIETTGTVLVSRLEARGYRSNGDLDPAELITWMKRD